jgi:hypothetical protein
MGEYSQNQHTMTLYTLWALSYCFFPKFCYDLHRLNSVRVHPYSYLQHMMVTNIFYISNMDVERGQRGNTASTINQHIMIPFVLHLTPIFQNLVPICTGTDLTMQGCTHIPSTSYEGDQTLSIYPIWMWKAVRGGNTA